MSHKAWVTFIISLFLWSAANAQQRTLTGKVVADKSNRPIEFASVQVKDHELWAFTDQHGLFTIKNAPNGTLTIVVQSLGYVSENVNVTENGKTIIRLKEDNLTLELLKRCLQIAYTDSVREEKGGTYGVSVDYEMDPSMSPNVVFKIAFHTDPAKYDILIPIVYQQISNIANNGPLALSMDKMKKYLTKAYGQSITHDDYWDTMMYEWLRHGIDYHTGFLDILNSVTSDDVQQCAKDMLNANRRIEITQMSE